MESRNASKSAGPGALAIRLREVLHADKGDGPSRENLEARLEETNQKIGRLVEHPA
jgi:hypothetical protein